MQLKSKARILESSPIFSGLNEEELIKLADLTVERNFMSNEFIFWEGDSPEWFYMVVEGKVKVLKNSSSGKEFIIAFFDHGEIFGEVAVFEDKPYPASGFFHRSQPDSLCSSSMIPCRSASGRGGQPGT